MYSHARHLWRSFVLACVTALLLSTPLSAQEISVVNASWVGNDYVIQFSDSLHYTVDLGASDSMLVLAFSRPIRVVEGETKGPNNISAAFWRNPGDSMVMLAVRGNQRVGYSTLWRPYSNRLIVHTFNWDSLGYGAEQYHKGLLALEQGLPEQGRSYFSSAIAFDNGEIARRASSILGVMYTREGKDSLALVYLHAPWDADDFMARSELNRRAGDLEAATADEEVFRQKMADPERLSEMPTPIEDRDGENPDESRPPIAEIFDDWRGILLVAIGALLIIALAVWFSRRPVAPTGTSTQAPHKHDHSHDHHHAASTTESTTTQTTVETPAPTPPVHPTAPVTVARESQTERPQSAPDPIISSLQVPEILTQSTEIQSVGTRSTRASESADLPHPDALPDRATEAEVYQTRVQIEAETKEVEAREVETGEAKRGSAQADQLRRRMEAATSGVGLRQSAKPTHSSQSHEPESTVTEARRLNVSRDYVELRNRIAELRKRIDEE